MIESRLPMARVATDGQPKPTASVDVVEDLRRQRARHGDRRRCDVDPLRGEGATPHATGIERKHAILVEIAERRPVTADDAGAR